VHENKSQQNLARYFIAIIPPSPIFEEALSLKNYFKGKYNSKASLNSPPHITLHMPFLWKEEDENELINSLSDFAKGQESIEILLTDFGAFAPRVIFISLQMNEKLSQFQKQLEGFCKTELNLFNAQYKGRPFHPHVTLAFRDLKKSMFLVAWNEFKEKKFSATFFASGFDLMKHDGNAWHSIRSIHF
jgi:2'-5' RNA ligase